VSRRPLLTMPLHYVVLTVLLMAANTADAVPSMGRQTGMQCASCHTTFPNLTPFGRQFKLRGYTLSSAKLDDSIFGSVPVSFLLQGSRIETSKTATAGAGPSNFPRDGENIVQAAGLYYGGKIAGKAGALVQYFYDGIERKWAMEMFDARYADATSAWGGKELVFGVTLNNNPTVTDLYNSTPQWGFPHAETAAVRPNAGTLVDLRLAGQVAGPSVYALWNNLIYGEFGLYRNTLRGLLRPLGWGVEKEDVVSGTAPYWRLALQQEYGIHSFSLGTYGVAARVYAEHNNFSIGTDRYRDIAFDGQYQYIAGDHIVTSEATLIRERQRLRASFQDGLASNAESTLRTIRAGAHYYYRRKWGGGLQYFTTSGSQDSLRYDTGAAVTGSTAGSPDSKGWIGEVAYFPWQNVRLSLRYTAYREFNGGRDNYDGFGRRARDNNSLFLLAWLMW
jgi:hypothetical protein